MIKFEITLPHNDGLSEIDSLLIDAVLEFLKNTDRTDVKFLLDGNTMEIEFILIEKDK